MPNKAWGVGSMTEGNIFSTDKKTVIIVFIARTCYQRQTKLFKFSQDTERKGWTKKKLCHFAVALLQ